MLILSTICTEHTLWSKAKSYVNTLSGVLCQAAIYNVLPIHTFIQDLKGRNKKEAIGHYFFPTPACAFVSKYHTWGLQVPWVKTWESVVLMLQAAVITETGFSEAHVFLDSMTSSGTVLWLVVWHFLIFLFCLFCVILFPQHFQQTSSPMCCAHTINDCQQRYKRWHWTVTVGHTVKSIWTSC